MNRQKWKQLLLYGLMIGTARVSVAECYPLLPALFGALLLEEVNRTLLLIFTLFGMALFLPVQAVAKYGMMILTAAVAVKLVEWVAKSCRTWIGASICAVSSLCMTIAGEVLQIRNRSSLWLGFLEGVFVFAFIMVASPVLHAFLEGRGAQERRKAVKAPENGARLQSYAESFNGLSRLFSQMSHQKEKFEEEEMGRFQQEITGRLCISCDQCALCWEQENSPMYQIFYRLLYSMEKLGMPDKEVCRALEECCPYARAVIEEAVGVFEKARLNLAWYNRLLENREVIAQQLDAMAYIMEDCAKEYTDISREEGKLLAAVKYRLKERGAAVREIHLYEKSSGRLSLQLEISSKWGNCIAVKDLAKAVSLGLGKNMVPVKSSKTLVGKEEAALSFEEAPMFRTLYGVARLSKDGAQISGDNFSFLDLEGGQSVLTLSDGMGSGIRACKESEMVIELIEKFLETGFQKETAIRMMNSAMVMHGEDGMYSTVDMASIDLYTGGCEFYKIGASTTFIKHGEQIETVSSASLPAGIFTQVEIEKCSRQLKDGDFVILVSDGVMDYLHVPNPEETISGILETIQMNNPGQLAKYILERILLFTGGKVPDDMTVLTAGVWER